MYCRICGKEGARVDWGELCRKCKKEHKFCPVCGGLYLKKEIINGACFMCREDKDYLM